MIDMNCYISPFTYREKTKLVKYNGEKTRGISCNRLQELWVKEEIDIETLIIMKIIYEFEYLTAHLLLIAMLNEKIPAELLRVTSGDKNPYHRKLKYLEIMGIVTIYSFATFEGNIVGSHIYKLSPGATEWIKSVGGRIPTYYTKNKKNYYNLGYELSAYRRTLSRLALNQCYMKIVTYYNKFLTSCFFIDEQNYPAAYIETINSIIIGLIAPRAAGEDEQLILYIRKFFNLIIERSEQSLIILIVESLQKAKEIHQFLSNRVDVIGRISFLYVTDLTTYSEGDILKHLINFKTCSAINYEYVSIMVHTYVP